MEDAITAPLFKKKLLAPTWKGKKAWQGKLS